MTRQIDDWVEKREFNRLSMEFMVDVIASNTNGEEFIDNVALFDVSGGGARIMTDHRNRYFTGGQSLELTVYLPPTAEGRAFMNGRATDIWVGREFSLDGMKVGVGVRFDAPLNFNRDVKED